MVIPLLANQDLTPMLFEGLLFALYRARKEEAAID